MRKGRLDFDPLARPAPIIPGQDSTKEQIEAERLRRNDVETAKQTRDPRPRVPGPWRTPPKSQNG